MAVSPSLPTLQALTNPPTNGETLHMFTPPDSYSAQVEKSLTSHPEAVALRQNPSFTESRPHMKIPEAARQHNFTGGTLAGPGRIVVPPLTFIEDGGKSYVAMYYLGTDLCGHPGIVHGGLIATIIDEGLARCCFPTLPNKVGMTASLKLDYRAPMPTDRYIVLRATTTKVEGRKAWVEGRVETLLTEEEIALGQKAVVYAEASALFIEPRQAAVSDP
jgi:3'-phosphoadenosine 5'-phosphosulfate synthase